MLRLKALARSASAVWATRAAALLFILLITPVLPAGQSPAPDTFEPFVYIASPAEDETVSGMVTINAEAFDASGVAGVIFEVDGAAVGAEDVTAPWSFAWDANASGSGSHLLTVIARDGAGNAARSDTVPVVVAAVVSPPNRNPVAVGDSLASVGRVPVTFTGASLLANDSDPDGQALRITAVASSSAGGGSIGGTSSSDSYQYTPAVTFSGVDAFTYSIEDSEGGTASAVVSVTVTAPVVTVPVPSVVGATQAAAMTTITGAGLTVITTNANSATVPSGDVISQTPLGGVSVPVGSAVALVISSGPAPSGGLVAAFGFEEATGLTAINSSNSAFNGTIRGALRQGGKFGNALFFDGVNDWVTVTDGVAGHPLDLTTGMTLEAWVNPAELSGWETAVLKERGAGLLSYALYAHDGAPEASGFAAPAGYVRAAGADQPVRDTLALPLNTWTHIATTYDGANERLYISGVLVATRAQTGNIAVGNGALRIGGNNAFAGEFFQGLIDEVRVYTRALSAAEITADMNTRVVP